MLRITSLIVLASIASPAFSQTTFHADVERSGVYSSAGPVQAPAIRWTFKTAGPIVTSPAVAGGSVYVGSLSGHLYAIDAQTGKERWNFKSRMPIASSPAVADGTFYFTSSAGSLAAIDAATGQPKWVFAGEYERKFEARNLHGYPSPAQTIPDAWDVYTSSPAVVKGKVYFGSGDGNVYALDASTGVLQWKFPTGDVVHASPAVVDGTVYVGCRDAHVYAIDAATGRRKWDYPTSKSWVNATPAVRDGTVYVGTSDSSRFMALDARTGRLRWNFDAKSFVFSSAALAGELAYFGSHNGRLYAVNARTGQLAWEFQTEASKQDPMKILNPDGSLNRASFSPVFGDFQDMYIDFYRYVSVGAIMGSSAVAEGVLYIGSMDGNLYALG